MDTTNMPGISLRKFLYKAIFFLLILGVVRFCIGWFIPYHTGGRHVSEKIRYIEDNSEKVDIIFLGSSRIRRGVIPNLFDSITNGFTKRAGISYNLGNPASAVGENLYLLRNYAGSDAGKHLKTVMIEWVGAYLPTPVRYGTERARYWMDAQSLAEQVALMKSHPGLTTAVMQEKIQYAFGAFLHRNLGLRRVSNVWMDTFKSDISEEVTKGYHRVYDRHALHISKKESPTTGIRVYGPKQAQSAVTNARKIHAMEHLVIPSEDVRLWGRLINKYKQQGIRLVIMIPPGPVNERQLALIRRLPKGHYIDLSDPDQYPELYNPDLFYDFVHLNHDGAKLLTQYLAEAYLKLEEMRQ